MRRFIGWPVFLTALLTVLAGSAQAQTCNIADLLKTIKDENSAQGAGQFVRLVQADLDAFKKHLLELMAREDVIPPASPNAASLNEKVKEFASISEDVNTFDELLKDVVAAKTDFGPPQSDLCSRCRLGAAYNVFKDAEYSYVNADIVDKMKGLKSFADLKRDSKSLSEEKARSDGGRKQFTDAYRDAIRGYLGQIPYAKGETPAKDWLARYGTDANPKIPGAAVFFISMKDLGKDKCGE